MMQENGWLTRSEWRAMRARRAAPATRPVVLIHGLLSTPREFGLIALPLRAAGVPLIAVEVEGYTDADRRRPKSWRDWVDAAGRAVERAAPKDRPFVLGGLCTGGLIAAMLALEGRFDLDRLVLMSPTFAFDGWGQTRLRHWRRAAYALRLSRWISLREQAPYGIKNEKLRLWVEKDMRQRAQSAAGPDRLPLWGVQETERLKTRVLRGLPQLAVPATLLHARSDEVCSFEVVERVVRTMHEGTTLVALEDSFHMITLDNDRARVAAELIRAATGGANASSDPRPSSPSPRTSPPPDLPAFSRPDAAAA
jgi:carboxylesterase